MEWNPVPELFILGYKVLVQNTSFSQFVAWNVNSTLIESLHSNTSYVIKVFPVHGLPVEGIPPESFQSIIVTTKADRGKKLFLNVLVMNNKKCSRHDFSRDVNSLTRRPMKKSKEVNNQKVLPYCITRFPQWRTINRRTSDFYCLMVKIKSH